MAFATKRAMYCAPGWRAAPGSRWMIDATIVAIRFDIRPTRSALEPRDLVAPGRNRSLQCRHLFQKLQNQVLQLGRRLTVNILRRRHAHKESDSRRLENLIIIPMPRLLPL